MAGSCPSLKDYTTFRIGGPARYFYRPKDLKELRAIVSKCHESGSRPRVLGRGSNLLIADKGVEFPVIKLDAVSFRRARIEGGLVDAGAGKPLAQLLALCAREGLSGLEFLAGIPGTVGGALAMNAGVTLGGRRIAVGDLVESVTVLDYNNNLKFLEKSRLKFAYRNSNLARYVIISARFRLDPDRKSSIQKRIDDHLRRRRISQDYGRPSAGCVFRNPAGDSAGRLIDSCGLKGKKIGQAAVSEKHANFIVNTGQASANDVLKLMSLIKARVKKKFRIALEPEIKIWK